MRGDRSDAIVYDAILGEAVNRLAPPVRAFHRAASPASYAGRASVERGTTLLSALVAVIAGLPRSNDDTAVFVTVTRDEDGRETWARKFGNTHFVTRQERGKDGWAGLLVEHVGATSVAYAISERRGELHLEVRGWRFCGIPMPLYLAPRAVAFETGTLGRFNFDVAISMPIAGLLVHYRGWLEPA